MIKKIYKIVNDNYSNFKNTCFEFFISDEVKKFITYNSTIANLAQLNEFNRILKICKEINFPLHNKKIENLQTNFKYFEIMISCVYTNNSTQEGTFKFLKEFTLEVFVENKDFFLSSELVFSKTFLMLKDMLDKHIYSKLNEVILNLIHQYSKLSKIQNIIDLDTYIDLIKNILKITC